MSDSSFFWCYIIQALTSSFYIQAGDTPALFACKSIA